MGVARRFTADEARRLGAAIGIDWSNSPFDVEQCRGALFSNVFPLMVLSFDRLPSTCRSTTVQTFKPQLRMGFCHPTRFPANMQSG
jgi:hypothetical protein